MLLSFGGGFRWSLTGGSTVGLSHYCKTAKPEFCDFRKNDENL